MADAQTPSGVSKSTMRPGLRPRKGSFQGGLLPGRPGSRDFGPGLTQGRPGMPNLGDFILPKQPGSGPPFMPGPDGRPIAPGEPYPGGPNIPGPRPLPPSYPGNKPPTGRFGPIKPGYRPGGGGISNPFIPSGGLKGAIANRLGGMQQLNPNTGRNPYRSLQSAALNRIRGM